MEWSCASCVRIKTIRKIKRGFRSVGLPKPVASPGKSVYTSLGSFFTELNNVIETTIGRFENAWDDRLIGRILHQTERVPVRIHPRLGTGSAQIRWSIHGSPPAGASCPYSELDFGWSPSRCTGHAKERHERAGHRPAAYRSTNGNLNPCVVCGQRALGSRVVPLAAVGLRRDASDVKHAGLRIDAAEAGDKNRGVPG